MAGSTVEHEFWQGRRVLVTGHTGFKGSWLTLWLASMGAEVHGIALDPDTTPSHFDLAGIGALMAADHRIDIRDRTATTQAIHDANPEIVFHLAAQPLVRLAHAQPVETFDTNVMGTVHVLDAVRQLKAVRACIAITTDKVYRNLEWPWPYRESDALGGREPYGASKAACEMVIEAWRHSWFVPQGIGLLSVRAGNVIGGGDWAADRLIPDFVRATLEGRPLVLRNPEAVRPWQHVLEPLKGYLVAAQRLTDDPLCLPEAINFGPDPADFCTVRQVVDQAIGVWGAGAGWHHEPDGSVPESRLLTIDNALAREALGWQPTWAIDDCIDKTIGWYRTAAQPGTDVAALSRAEIATFEEGKTT